MDSRSFLYLRSCNSVSDFTKSIHVFMFYRFSIADDGSVSYKS